MNFDYQGYELKFIQRDRCRDGSAHLYSYIYKFYSPVTGYHYIIRAEYHEEDVFSVKFYAKKDSKSDFKYSKIINKGDLPNILLTCAKIIPLLLKQFPTASFAFAGARSVDPFSRTIENFSNTQRFRLYRYLVRKKVGIETFEHIEYEKISSYLLLNKKAGDLEARKASIERMFAETYNNLFDLLT